MSVQTLRCPHCSAPLTRVDGKEPTECPYCKSALDFSRSKPLVGEPPRGSSGGAIAVGITIFIVVMLAGAGAAVFLVSRPAPPPPIVVSVPMPVAVPAPPPEKKVEPPSPVKQVLRFGDQGTNPGQLDHATHLAVTPDGSIFVGESSSGRVQKFDATGKYVDVIALPPDKLTLQKGVFGMAADAKGHVYVNRVGDVLIYDGATLKQVKAVNGSYPELYYHGGIAPLATGGFLVTVDNTGDLSLVTISPAGKVVSQKKTHAHDVAVDGTGHVFLVGDDGLEVRDEKGEVQAKIGAVKGRSVAYDGKGHVFIATGSAVEVVGIDGAKLVTLPVHTGELTLDAAGRLYALGNEGVTVWEVTLP
ncbi:MAG: hypothetical protein U0228_23315 [Myxococcaceae bacterium]